MRHGDTWMSHFRVQYIFQQYHQVDNRRRKAPDRPTGLSDSLSAIDLSCDLSELPTNSSRLIESPSRWMRRLDFDADIEHAPL
jgi:hypothetical protein